MAQTKRETGFNAFRRVIDRTNIRGIAGLQFEAYKKSCGATMGAGMAL